MLARLFINNLPFTLEEDALRIAIEDVLSHFGTVKSLICLCESTGMRPKGVWFAQMQSRAEVFEAVRALNGLRVGGKCINVAEAKPRLVVRDGKVLVPR